MKKTLKNKKNDVIAVGSFLVCLCVVFLSVGFSAFQTSLDISDISAIIRVQKDIRITGVSIANVESNAISNYEDYNVNGITSSISLPNSNSTITYDVEITNIGNVEMGILNITGLPNNLEYSISNYTLKDTLCDDTNGTQCKLGSISTLSITIGYANNGYNSENTNYQINLDLDFKRVFTITYNGFSNVSGLPTTILAGDTKTIPFTNQIGIPYAVRVNNATGSYTSPTLTLSNATDDVTINRYYQITYVLNGGTNDADNPDRFLSSENITLNEPTFTDHIFDGWYETSDFSGNVVTNISNRNSDITLYAKFTLDSNGPTRIDSTTWYKEPVTFKIQLGACWTEVDKRICGATVSVTNDGDSALTAWTASFDLPEDISLEANNASFTDISMTGNRIFLSNASGFWNNVQAHGSKSGNIQISMNPGTVLSLDNGSLDFTTDGT